MSGLQIFIAFMLGGLCVVGHNLTVAFALRAPRKVNLLTPEDIDRMWLEAHVTN